MKAYSFDSWLPAATAQWLGTMEQSFKSTLWRLNRQHCIDDLNKDI